MRLLGLGVLAGVAAVGLHGPCGGIVVQMHPQALLDDPRLQYLVQHRECHLDATEQVAVHPVRTGQVDHLGTVNQEVIDAVMLEEAPDDGAHRDVLRQARHSRAQRAHPTDDQVDLHAGARRLVQLVDDRWLQQRIHLGHDARGLAGAGVAGLRADMLHQVALHGEW